MASDAAAGPAFLVIAWWITFLLSAYLPPIVVVLRAVAGEDRTLGEVLVTGSLTRIALVVAAALLAAVVLVMVEYQQHMALLRRSQVVLDAEPIRL